MLGYEPIGGKWTFFCFAIPTLIGILFTKYLMKETKGIDPFKLKRLYSSESNASFV